MHTRVPLWLMLIACLGMISTVLADEGDNPEARAVWMQGYDRFELAQKAERARQYPEAEAHYRAAYEIYARVKTKWPKWNPFVLDYRLKFCRDKVRELQAKTQVRQQELKPTQVAEINQQLQQQVDGFGSKVQELTAQNTRLSQALEKARSEAARGAESARQAEKLAWENRELKQRLESGAAKQQELVAELQALEEERGLKEAYDKLQAEVQNLQQKRAEFEEATQQQSARIDELLETSKRLSVERAQLQLKVQEADNASAQIRRNLQAAVERVEELKKERQELRQTLGQREQQNANQRQEIGRLRAGLEAVEQRTNDAEKAQQLLVAREKELSALREEAQLMRDEINQARVLTARQKEQLDQLQMTNAKLRDKTQVVDVAREKLAALQEEHAAQQKRLAAGSTANQELARKLDSQVAVSRSLKADLDKAQAELKVVRERSEAKTQEQEVRNHALQVDLEEVRNQLAVMEKTRDAVAEELGAARKRLGQVEQELAHTRKVYGDALQDTTADKVVAERDALRDQVAALKTQLLEAGAAPESELQALVKSRAERIAELEMELRESAVLREQVTRLPELQANMARLDQLQTQARMVPDLQTRVEVLERELAAAREGLPKVQDGDAVSALLQKRIAATEADIHEKTAALNTLRQQHGELRARVEDAENVAGLREQARQQAINELADLQRAMKSTREHLAAARVDREQAVARQQAVAQERDKALAQRDELRELTARMEGELKILKEARQRLADQAETVANDQGRGGDAEMLRERIEQLQKVVTAQRELMTQKDTRFEKLDKQHEQLQAELKAATAQRQQETTALRQELNKALEEYNAQRQLVAEERAARQRAEAVLSEADVKALAEGGLTRAQEEEVHELLSQALKAEKDDTIEGAIWFYKQVLEIDATNLRALKRLGNIMADKGEYHLAEGYLMRAFYENPDDQDILLPLGFILVRTEKGDLAISMLSRAVALFPENADFHRFLGVACRSLGWAEAAEVQFQRSHKLDASHPDTAFNLAILYSTLQPPQMEKAREWYKKARSLGAELDPGLERLFEKTN